MTAASNNCGRQAENARNTVMTTPRMRDTGDRFPVETIRRYSEELADHLEPRQAMALYNIAFWMEQADVQQTNAHETLDEIDRIEKDPTPGAASPKVRLMRSWLTCNAYM